MVGNPGAQIGWMSAYGERLSFDKDGWATCQATGEAYELREGLVYRQ